MTARLAPWGAALLGMLVYAGTLGAGFVYDDYPYVVENADLRGGPGRLPDLFRSSFPSFAPERGLYRPVTAATYLLDRIGDAAPSPVRHHATNILLAGAMVLAVHVLLRRVLPAAAALVGALLFAVHPVHAEAVAWVTGRSEILAATFGCLALAGFLDCARGGGRWGKLAAACLALAAGILAKENAAVVLPLFVLAVLVLPDVAERRAVPAAVAALGATAGALAIRFAVLGALAPAAGQRVGAAGLPGRMPLVFAAAGEHLRLLLWPHPLHVERMPLAPTAWSDASVIAGMLTVTAWAALLVVLRRRRGPWLLATWPVVALLPVLHLVPIGETVAERFLLLPSVGFCGLLGWALTTGSRAAGARRILAAVMIAAGAAGTVQAAAAWKDERSLWRNAIAHSPESAGAWAGLGDSDAHAGEPDQAVPRYRKALEIDPGLTVARLALATALERIGDSRGALEESRRAVLDAPDHPAALNNLGARLARAGRTGEAEELFRRAVAAAPRYAPALRNAALAALDGGRPDEARAFLERARAADPQLPGLQELTRRLSAGTSPAPETAR